MTANKKTFKLDIFDVLRRLAKKDTAFNAAEMKELQPMVVMRWLSGTSSARQVYFLNEFVNRYCFQLGDHKQLLVNLMTVCTSGRAERFSWIKRVSSAQPKTKMIVKVISEYYNYPTRRAAEVVGILSPEAIREFAEELGYQKDDMKLLEKELKNL